MSAGDRESEAQAKKGEDGQTTEGGSRAATALKEHWCVCLRIVEFILAVIAIGLLVGTQYAPQVLHSNIRHISLVYSAYSNWHRSYYANVRPNKGAYDLILSSGVFAVIDAAVFLIHAFFTFRKEADY
ncbi:jg17603 [Pararge aegeria aegeria]|nr:jg17603 [Pararge aegeria aegeria]